MTRRTHEEIMEAKRLLLTVSAHKSFEDRKWASDVVDALNWAEGLDGTELGGVVDGIVESQEPGSEAGSEGGEG